MATSSRIVALLPLVALGYRDSGQTFSTFEVSAASVATPAATDTAVQRGPGLEWASDCQANASRCVRYSIPSACEASLDSCRDVLPTLHHLIIANDSSLRHEVAKITIPAICAHAAELCEEVLPLVEAFGRDSAEDVRQTVAEYAFPAACKAVRCRGLLPLLRSLSEDSHVEVRRLVGRYALPATLRPHAGCNDTMISLHVLERDLDTEVRVSLAKFFLPAACRAGCCQEMVPTFMRLSNDSNIAVRRRLVWYSLPLACVVSPSTKTFIPAIVSLANDSNSIVRRHVAFRLIPAACRAGLCEELLPSIKRLATDEAEIVEPLARLVMPRACEAGTGLCMNLLSTMSDMGSNPVDSVRVAVADAALTVCMATSCEQFLPLLVKLNNDAVPHVRASANRSLHECTERSQLSAEYAAIGNLSKQADQPMTFSKDHVLKVPPGVAMKLVRKDPVKLAAHRCPNWEACPGNQVTRPNQDPSLSPPTCGLRTMLNGPCANSYDADVPGCAGCREGHGRSTADPFKCNNCGKQVVNILWFILAPLGVFVVGIKSALNPNSERFGSLYKITISYGTSCFLILNALLSSPIGKDIAGKARNAFSLSLTAADGISGFKVGTIDCLLGRPADVGEWIVASNVVPLSLLFISIVVASAWGCMCTTDEGLVTLVVRPILVVTNSFLPSMLTAFLHSWPCYHTQKMGDLTERMMMYQIRSPCPSYTSWHSLLGVIGCTLLLASGPGLWCVLLAMSEKGDETDYAERQRWDARLMFLTGAYKAKTRWWEVVVMVRKVAFAIIVALCPQSYALGTHLLAVLMVLGVALSLHLTVRPYAVPDSECIAQDGKPLFSLNLLEASSLTISFLCMGATAYVTTDTWSQSKLVSLTLVHAAVFLLSAFGTLLFCLLAYEGLPKLKGMARASIFSSGETATLESSAEGQQSEDSGVSGDRSVLRFAPYYCVMFFAVLVPDLIAVFVYSPVGLGPDIYDGITSSGSNLLGNCMAIVSACWLTVLFVFDMFDAAMWEHWVKAVVRFLSIVILVVLVFTGLTLKSVKCPWAPLLMCMVATVCLLAVKRVQCSGSAVGLPHFYLATAICYGMCATAMLVVWIFWVMSADGPRDLWWNTDTERWLVHKYAGVYRVLTPVELASESSPLELQEYCLHRSLIHSGIGSADIQDLVASACGRASTVIFTQWAGPVMVFACNLLGVCFCLLFSNTMAKISRPEDVAVQSKKEALLAFMKRFLLIVALAVAMMYTSLYVSGAAAKLGSAMLALTCIAFFVMLLWLSWEVDGHSLDEMKDETPLMKNVISILQSNWVKAVAVGGMNVVIPFLVILDQVRQQVRKSCTNYYGRESGSERNDDQHTPSGRRLRESLARWNWTDILGKVCVLAEVFVLLAVGSKATFIFFSFLNGEIEAAGLEIVTIFVMVWAIGLVMFLNPIVPGSAVYLFAGVVLGAQSQKDGSVGIWAGLVLACVAGSGAKLMACVGQYSLGYFLGQSVKVQQFVGVTKVGVLATESVLKEKGFKLFKVCILVAGPDFPTSVLCGILQLNIPQMLLGTSPVIMVSIIPQTLVGVLLTKEDASEGVWSMVATVATGLAAAFQAGATLVFAYGIMQRVEVSGEQLLQTPRPEHDEVRKLADKEAEYVEIYAEMSDWWQLGKPARATLLGAVAFFLLSGFLIALDTMATEKICFEKFYITDDIKLSSDLGGLDGNVLNVIIQPLGSVALGLAAVALVLHVGFGKWLAAKARAAPRRREYSEASDGGNLG